MTRNDIENICRIMYDYELFPLFNWEQHFETEKFQSKNESIKESIKNSSELNIFSWETSEFSFE